MGDNKSPPTTILRAIWQCEHVAPCRPNFLSLSPTNWNNGTGTSVEHGTMTLRARKNGEIETFCLRASEIFSPSSRPWTRTVTKWGGFGFFSLLVSFSLSPVVGVQDCTRETYGAKLAIPTPVEIKSFRIPLFFHPFFSPIANRERVWIGLR